MNTKNTARTSRRQPRLTEMFEFGWRHPICDEVVSELEDLLSGFPHAIEIERSVI